MGSKKNPGNPFYGLLIVAGAALVVTILAMLTSLLTLDPFTGEEQVGVAPPARLMNRWGGTLVFAEIVVLVASSMLAILLDRLRSRRQKSG